MQPGTVVAGRYLIEAFAGLGGMSSVFQARDRDGRMVALKVLQSQATHLDARFLREASLLHRLRHPAIVSYLDSGVTDDGLRFLVIEWLEGVDLYSRIRKERLSLRETLQVMERMAAALGFAHAQGVVHRDVKPNNIFLPESNAGLAKLLDFGIARWASAGDVLTRTGTRFGTPAYMSPEQVRGDSDLDARADVFSLGCVLFECLTGEPAFAAKDPMAVFGKILFADPPRASSVVPDVPASVDALLQRMLARSPDDRPRDGGEVTVEIRRLRASLSSAELSQQPAERDSRDILTDLEQRLVSVVVAAIGDAAAGDGEGEGGGGGAPGNGENEWEGAWQGDDDDGEMFMTIPTPVAAALASGDKAGLSLPLPAPRSGPSSALDDMATMAVTGHDAQDGAMAAPPPAGALDELGAQFDALGAQLVVLRDGSLVAVLENRSVAGNRTAADQAVDATRCALALRRAFARAPVALATGRAVVGQEGFVGEVIDRAVQLLAEASEAPTGPAGEVPLGSAPPPWARAGGIRIDEVTAGLAGTRFDITRDTGGAFWLHGEHGDGMTSRPPAVAASPFVGRNGELATLTAILDECMGEQVARAVLVTGPAGYGKSRLGEELLRHVQAQVEGLEVWTAHGDLMRAGSPLHLLSMAVRHAAGIIESEPVEVRRDKLRARVARYLPAEDAGRVTVFLGEMLKIPAEDEDDVQLRAARMDPKLMGDQVRRACADLLDAETLMHPLLLVLEDLHWGDRATVEVLDLALRNLADRPLLVLALGRPDVHELFPQLWAAHNITVIRLSRLPRRAAERLVRAGVGSDVASERLDAIVERGDGNPFYLEELVRRVAAGESTLPETVMAMVHARLGALDPLARRLLRAASVFGRTFWRGGVVALTGDEVAVDGWLQGLVELDLVVAAPASRFSGEAEYSFRHALILEGAYSMLTDGDRQLGHRVAGDWLEQAGEDDAQVLAEHFDRGGAPERALGYYRRAAEDSLGRSDFDAAILMAERGIGCGAEGPVLGALRRVQMEERIWRGNTEDVVRLGLASMRLVRRGSREWYDIAGELAMAWSKLGESERVDDLAAELRASARSGSDHLGRLIAMAKLSQALFVVGRHEYADALLTAVEGEAYALDEAALLAANIHIGRAYRADSAIGDPGAVLEELERCAACFEAVGDVRNACLQRSNVGYARFELGLYEQAEVDLRSALAAAERMALGLAANAARQNLGLLLAYFQGEVAEAQTLELRASEWFEAQGDTRMAALSRLYLALILTLGLDLDGAEEQVRATLGQLPEPTPLRPPGLAILAWIHHLRGETAAALAAASEGMRMLEALGAIESGESLVRLLYAETLYAAGHEDEARVAIARTRDWLIERSGRISRFDWRSSFLEKIPHHARIFALAKRWSA